MSGEYIAHYVGVVLGAFIFVTIVSRPVWYIITKVGDARAAMIVALCWIVLILILRWTSATRQFDIVHEISLVIAVLMWLLLDWRVALERERKKKVDLG